MIDATGLFKVILPVAPKTFQEVWCEKSNQPKDVYDEKVLLACMPRRYWLVGLFIWHFYPHYLSTDLDIVRQIATQTTLKEIRVVYSEYQEVTGFLRGVLGIRITKQGLLKYVGKFVS